MRAKLISMKIKSIRISQLYQKYNFHWMHLDPKVNLIAGINGSFKTTLINILYDILNIQDTKYKLSNAIINLSDNIIVDYYSEPLSLRNVGPTEKERKWFAEQLTGQDLKHISDEEISNISTRIARYHIKQDGVKIDKTDYKKILNLDIISTFDTKTEVKKDSSLLDIQLEQLQSDYGYYLSDLAKQITDAITLEGNINKEKLDSINHIKNNFIAIVNKSFEDTGKTIDPNESKLTFILKNGEKIHSNVLSSGEKQLLIILLTILLEREKEYVVLMDEPEISLHIHWQYELIDNLIKLNPNAQFIIATHSPSIFGKGWGDKVQQISKLSSDDK